MTKHSLKAQNRQVTGRKVKSLRATGHIPANIFGKDIPSQSIQVNTKEFAKVHREVGEPTLVYLQLAEDKTERPTLISDVVIHPVTDQILHVSFHQVNLKVKVTAKVPVTIEGEAPAEKDGLGILVQQLDEVEIEALPTNMPQGLKVDISLLTDVNQAIHVKDLKLDTTHLTLKTDPEAILVKIEPLAKEEKAEAPITPIEGAVPAEGEVVEATAPTGDKKEEAKEAKAE